VIAKRLLDLPGMLVGGLLPLGVPLHARRIGDAELVGEVLHHGPRHRERVLEEQPDVADGADLEGEP
jgi:hypothetical protein